VLVGLFLAILELIRSQLIWAEQNHETGKISLRATTDVPAEEAVRKAIMRMEAAETANQQAEAAREQQPMPAPAEELPAEPDSTDEETAEEVHELPIPIVEIPPADAPATGQQIETPQEHELPIPIAELPAKNNSRRQADELEPLNGQTAEQS
jgi:hypothetical protein